VIEMPDGVPVDPVDAAILDLFAAEPRIGVLEASRRLRLARGTVQARLDKLASRGIVTGWGPQIDTGALGFPVTAFVTLEIAQSGHDAIGGRLASIPEVLEVHTITGNGDLLCRVVARSNADLQRPGRRDRRHRTYVDGHRPRDAGQPPGAAPRQLRSAHQ